MKKYPLVYKIDDGYIGNRPHKILIDKSDIEYLYDLEDDELNAEIEILAEDYMIGDFETKVSPYIEDIDMDKFKEWAKKVIEEERKK